MRILVLGNSTRSIVCSAKKAGFTVYALDNFGDVDMHICADKSRFLGNASESIYELAHSFGEFDAVILGPGFERLKFRNILSNGPEVMEEVSDKLKIAHRFSSMDIPHPQTELLNKASGLRFPLMIKPRFGSGGMLNVVARNEDELAVLQERDDACKFIAQEFVDGIPCSASLIGTGDDAAIVALNEQLIGIPWLTRLPFAYCGNITPFHTKFDNDTVEYAKQIALQFRLLGSNGVDFIMTENGVVVLEINPRFQGSLDTVELSTGINIVDAHIKSFEGELPEPGEYVCFASKAIIYTDKKIVIDLKLSDRLIRCMNMKHAADIPQLGRFIRPDEPVTTLLEIGKTRQIVLEKIREYAHYINGITEV